MNLKGKPALLVVLLLLTGSLSLIIVHMPQASAVVIDSTQHISGDAIYYDDIYVQSGGHLIIDPGVTVQMDSGKGIFVEDGTLTVSGNETAWATITSTPGNTWAGIESLPDSTIVLDVARIKNADTGLESLSTGEIGQESSLRVVNSSFSNFNIGLNMLGGAISGPVDVTVLGNMFSNGLYGIHVNSGYDGITIQENHFTSMEEMSLICIDTADMNLIGNQIYGGKIGIGFNTASSHQNLVENNTLYNSDIGFYGVAITGLQLKNNSIMAYDKGVTLDSALDTLIENNTIMSLNFKGNNAGIEIDNTSPPTIIKDNIISSRRYLMRINGSALDYDIYNNHLTNLSDPMYIDTDGDGYTDANVRAPGTASAWIRMCRTAVVPVGTTGPTYATPAQAAAYGSPGTTYLILTNATTHGPKNVVYRFIYYFDMPHFESGVKLEGQERENLILWPVSDHVTFNGANGAALKNATIYHQDEPLHVLNSDWITLSNLHLFNGRNQGGIYIELSTEVLLEEIKTEQVIDFAISIMDCERVTIRDSFLESDLGSAVIMEASTGIVGQDTPVSGPGGVGIAAIDSSFSWTGSTIFSGDEAVIIDSCHNTSLNGIELSNSIFEDNLLLVQNSPDLSIVDCSFNLYHRAASTSAIRVEGDSQEMLVTGCRFTGGESAMGTVLKGVDSIGNLTGSIFEDNQFSLITSGVTLVDFMGIYWQGDILFRNNTFNNLTMGLFLMIMGDTSLDQNRFSGIETCIRNLGADLSITSGAFSDFGVGLNGSGKTVISDTYFDTGSNAIDHHTMRDDRDLTLMNVSFHDQKIGVMADGAPVMASDCDFRLVELPLQLTDSDGSLIRNSSLGNNPVRIIESTMIRARLDHLTESHIEVRNCVGIPVWTEVESPGTYVNWTYPLTVEVTDETGAPILCDLTISSLEVEIFNGSVDGTWKNENLPCVTIDHITSHDTSTYEVTAILGELINSTTVHLLRETYLNLVLNQLPVFSGPESITFAEDGNWTGNLSVWFDDNDEITFSVHVSISTRLNIDLEDGMLTIWGDENWFGNETIVLACDDSWGDRVEVQLLVNVTPVNDAPSLDQDLPVMSSTEDTSIWINLSEWGSDIDGPYLSWGSYPGFTNCTQSWDVENLTIIPDPDWFGILSIPLYLTDGEHFTNTTLTINVSPVNDAPIWTGDDPLSIVVDAGVSTIVDLSAYIEDVDSTDLVFSTDSGFAGYAGGDLIFSYPDSEVDWTDTVALSISDGEYTVAVTLDVTVRGEGSTIPGGVLEIDEVNVEIDEDTGDWTVTASGDPDQNIHIVIDGVGSFELVETHPGNYSVTIPADEFKRGETYPYHFSGEEDGVDWTEGEFEGTMDQPGSSEKEDSYLALCCIISLATVIVLLVLIIIVVMARRRVDQGYEE